MNFLMTPCSYIIPLRKDLDFYRLLSETPGKDRMLTFIRRGSKMFLITIGDRVSNLQTPLIRQSADMPS